MYDKNDVKIEGNRILVKEYDPEDAFGIKYFIWVTFIEVNTSKCIRCLPFFMEDLRKTIIN